MKKYFYLVVGCVLLSGCTTGNSYFLEANRTLWTSSFGENKVMIFGGINHKTYLGNIMSSNDPESVFNKSGKYGGKNSKMSLRNPKGRYGSTSSSYSACNPHATHPPILKDKYNFVLGTFSLNSDTKQAPIGYLRLLDNICNILR